MNFSATPQCNQFGFNFAMQPHCWDFKLEFSRIDLEKLRSEFISTSLSITRPVSVLLEERVVNYDQYFVDKNRKLLLGSLMLKS